MRTCCALPAGRMRGCRHTNPWRLPPLPAPALAAARAAAASDTATSSSASATASSPRHSSCAPGSRSGACPTALASSCTVGLSEACQSIHWPWQVRPRPQRWSPLRCRAAAAAHTAPRQAHGAYLFAYTDGTRSSALALASLLVPQLRVQVGICAELCRCHSTQARL